ncbi:RING zinc finger protein-like protein [Lindgomyces ingoldianus]|uniref:RING zinc finger protein-like protein n=1 Tax=Lindgomyces ingoldianus TaxID=673940 RepID=A0ACB6RGW8_9PLEO|nr:RING zinc finger protein-like protein [Lindgomyces ingoldianus]KAF2478305.1 RING zinc finger protein-like protein [Lindgomyces ingoldianus]
MSKRQVKSQASSARAASGAFGAGFSTSSSSAFSVSSSPLAYVSEPPDLSSISDPNVVVYFRNLSKKDSTTKAKALEDMQARISSLKEPVEEGILEAWIKMYPRASIDNAKSVRQNAHTLHGQIAASAGKRIAKYMPKSVGAWLSGLYDSDRSVAEATQNSLRQVFNTPEKIQNIRRAYHKPLLEYCRDAIDKETALTLSDERTTSPDDAEAKYSRVISACISLVGSLLSNLKPEDLSKLQSEYTGLLTDDKLWGFASYNDAPIRRSIHRFLKTCLSKQPEAVAANLEAISRPYLSVALNSDQTGSAYDYLEALVLLTSAHPTVWTEHYKSKTSADRRLRQFLKKGSQSGPRDFWARLAALFNALPSNILPRTGADATEILSALHSGIVKKDEPRSNLETALFSYLEVTNIVCRLLPEQDRRKLAADMILPIISQYLRPSPENAQWTLPPDGLALASRALTILGVESVLQEEWPRYVEAFIGDIRVSAPEQSKDHERSQASLIQQAKRLASLQKSALSTNPATPLRAVFTKSNASIIHKALHVVRNRNGKPYGAAGTIAEFLHRNGSFILADKETKQQLEDFVQQDIQKFILSRSSSHLVDILYTFSQSPFFEETWGTCLKSALNEPDSPVKVAALEALLTSSKIPNTFELALSDTELQGYIKSSVQATLEGSLEWDSFNRILQSSSNILAPETTDEILSSMAKSLSVSAQAPFALQGFRQIVKQNPSLLRSFLSTQNGSDLLRQLLLASESPDDEISQEAAAVNSSLQTILGAESTSKQSVYDVIQHGLLDATQTSVSVETLVDLAKQTIVPGATWEEMAGAFPSMDDWGSALTPFLDTPPKTSLAITNPLGGAVYVVQSSSTRATPEKLPRDVDGYSPAFRIAQYVIRLFKNPEFFESKKLPSDISDSVLSNIALTVQLAGDNLGLAGANDLWAAYNPEVEADVMSFMTDAQDFIKQELAHLRSIWVGINPLLTWSSDLLSKCSKQSSATAYYWARVYSTLVSDAIELHGSHTSLAEDIQNSLKVLQRNKDILPLLGFLSAFKEPLAWSKSCERMCNELVADLTGLDIGKKPEDVGLRQLILLNAILSSQEEIAQSIAKQRIIFFVKHALPFLGDSQCPLPIRSELCRALTVLLPLMSDMYGEHWVGILNSLSTSWVKTSEVEENESELDSPIPFVHASLKLYAQLRILTQEEEPNDDLLEAWKESERDVANGLINLLKHSQHFPDEFHQPLKIVNDILARQISKVPLEHLESREELFPLLYVESQPVQQTAFDILHKQIPAAQEQISIDSALEKTTARLPEELLSLILESPTVSALAEENFERSIPLPLRGYLLSWLLVFDHLEYASFKVKNDYIEHIKEGEYLPGLLNFTFDFLGHAHNKPVDVSKFDVTTYTPDLEPPRRDTQWLLAHLYFLCLRHIPSLSKAWWIDCKSRPIAVTLEPWTQKYISPPVVTAALQSVIEWSSAQSTTDPDSPFTIKVSPRAWEINASYTIDEQIISMRITLPSAFPLSNARIEGTNRVAVNEQKWQSWMRTSLGAITLFNGTLIDALTTFKRNVDGAMKGQTECAICYSIVGSDKKLPDKRCGTCRNLFHGGCLFKWFKSSGSSSCPLCRNPFNYG